MPVSYIEIRDGDDVLFASPVGIAAPLETYYLHSLQLTPVIDEYRIIGGRIWTWEERVQSHNAGLPFDAPEHGSFVMAPPWMIVRGGRRAMESIIYRVGTGDLGKNRLTLRPFDEILMYDLYSSKRLTFAPSVRRLADSPVIGFGGDNPVRSFF
jgi:hypothetical protein